MVCKDLLTLGVEAGIGGRSVAARGVAVGGRVISGRVRHFRGVKQLQQLLQFENSRGEHRKRGHSVELESDSSRRVGVQIKVQRWDGI